MSIVSITTLVIALAALVTSCVSAYEMVRQSKNAVRPAIVVLETYTNKLDRDGEGRSLYLVNMGNAMAMNVTVVAGQKSDYKAALAEAGHSPKRDRDTEDPHRTEIAINRRAVLGSHYKLSVLPNLSMLIHYVDVNGTKYYTRYDGKAHAHKFGRRHNKSYCWRRTT